jgi:hypothetical protein
MASAGGNLFGSVIIDPDQPVPTGFEVEPNRALLFKEFESVPLEWA